MQTVVYSCPFVPAEWIAAHDLRPSRMLPRAVSASAAPAAGWCPYAWAFVDAVCRADTADAVVLTTTCDQMRRAAEWLSRESSLPVFLMHVPTTWQTVTAHKLYLNELERLGRFLVRLGGTEPSSGRLAEIMCAYDERRAALRQARGHLSARQFAEAVAAFHRDGTADFDKVGARPAARGVPLALVGGPLITAHFRIFHLIEKAGGSIVLDATTSGERAMPPPYDRRALGERPLQVLADAYFGCIPDAFRRPNTQLYKWLRAEISERAVRGIILRSYTWCDTWHVESQRMKEWTSVPLLSVTTGADEQIEGHVLSRIEAFIETLT